MENITKKWKTNINLSKTQLAILEELSNSWYSYFSQVDISATTNLPLSSVYGSLRGLVERGIVIGQNSRYKINFSNEIGWNFKKLNDSAKFYSLPNEMQSKAKEINQKLTYFYADKLVAFMIFGSAASMEIDNKSDIDFFILVSRKDPNRSFLSILTSEEKKFHFIEYDTSDFNNGYDEGDDFVISLLKNNLLLIDNNHQYLRRFFEKDLPIISIKTIHGNEDRLNELNLKIRNLVIHDHPLVYEKTKEYIKLKCRLFLLKSNIIPKSNKELMALMKERYPQYYKSYKNVSRKNAKETYIKLAPMRSYE